MKLKNILSGIDTVLYIEQLPDVDIQDIDNDSRNMGKNSLFIAASGYIEDAHPYVVSAYKKGCRYFVIDIQKFDSFRDKYKGAFFIPVKHLNDALFRISKNFFQDPSSKMKLIGITGTSGKTTTAFSVYKTLRMMGIKAGLVGTIEYRINDQVIPATNTTPDVLFLNRLMLQMVDQGVKYMVMEVSSHSLALGRVAGLNFDISAFTSFSQDHLDFHNTMEEYLLAKLEIFDLLSESNKEKKVALVNREIDHYKEIKNYALDLPFIEFKTYSLENENSDYYAKTLEMNAVHSTFKLFNNPIRISMIGITNVYNFTLVSALLIELGFSIDQFGNILKDICVPGRMEYVPNNREISVLIDYAHKPDALEKLLITLKEVVNNEGRIITVFGAGGDRDKSKRSIMGRIAGKYSDKVIITSDNPRTEDPYGIIREIEDGLKESDMKDYTVEENRAKAIRLALSGAKKNDIVVIAGKGHEDYQIINKTKIHFSDREEVEKFFKQF